MTFVQQEDNDNDKKRNTEHWRNPDDITCF